MRNPRLAGERLPQLRAAGRTLNGYLSEFIDMIWMRVWLSPLWAAVAGSASWAGPAHKATSAQIPEELKDIPQSQVKERTASWWRARGTPTPC